jgi:hypothetical protein
MIFSVGDPELVELDRRVGSSVLDSTTGSIEPDQLPTSGLATTLLEWKS